MWMWTQQKCPRAQTRRHLFQSVTGMNPLRFCPENCRHSKIRSHSLTSLLNIHLILPLVAGMTIEVELDGTNAPGAAQCVFVDSDSPSQDDVDTGTTIASLTFGSALTLDGPYLYCSTLSAANAVVTIAATATVSKGNDVTALSPVALTVYSEPGAPTISR